MAAIGPFSIDTYLPSFHEIGEKLNASPLQVQQTLSIYLFSFALMTLWHGAIADRFGRRKVVLVAKSSRVRIWRLVSVIVRSWPETA